MGRYLTRVSILKSETDNIVRDIPSDISYNEHVYSVHQLII